MGFKYWLVTLAVSGFLSPVLAQTSLPQKETATEALWGLQQNQALQDQGRFLGATVLRPVPEFEAQKFLLLGSFAAYETLEFRKALLSHLPKGMMVVFLVDPGQEQETKNLYSPLMDSSRLIIATNDSNTVSNGFWARDAFPYPVYRNSNLQVDLIGAIYFRPFEGKETVAEAVHAPLLPEPFVFVGGNLLSDEFGNCFVVNSTRLFGLTDITLQQAYGCKNVYRLAHIDGIGDVDEVIKVLPGKKILTNIPDYVSQLQSYGYSVTLLPRLSNYRTYANSVILGQTIIMPSYNLPSDETAKNIYESFGYHVVMVNSETVSTTGYGSFHCMTMQYPAMDVGALLTMIRARK